VAGAGSGWTADADGAATGDSSWPEATSEFNPIATVKTEASRLRISFSLLGTDKPIRADDNRGCNRVGHVFAAVYPARNRAETHCSFLGFFGGNWVQNWSSRLSHFCRHG
jgi:hypothetical protein